MDNNHDVVLSEHPKEKQNWLVTGNILLCLTGKHHNYVGFRAVKKQELADYLSYISHWLGAYRTYALYSGHIFVRFTDFKDVFT